MPPLFRPFVRHEGAKNYIFPQERKKERKKKYKERKEKKKEKKRRKTFSQDNEDCVMISLFLFFLGVDGFRKGLWLIIYINLSTRRDR
jgi:hypothetical protein